MTDQKKQLICILDNIRSAYNVGSVLRTAECSGITKVVCCGYTPRANHPKVLKTSLLFEEGNNGLESDHEENLNLAASKYIDLGYKIFVFESGDVIENSKVKKQNFWDINFPKLSAFIFGNEVVGVQFTLVEIPMFGEKSSLNIANSAAIAIYEFARQYYT